jgi:hypothetical protein
VLKHDERVDEIEVFRHPRQGIVGERKSHVRESALLAVAACLLQHRWRNIDAHDVMTQGRERDEQATDAAAEVECVARNEILVQVAPNVGDQAIHMMPAGSEELLTTLGRERLPEELRVTEDSEVRVAPAVFFPRAVSVERCHLPLSRLRP